MRRPERGFPVSHPQGTGTRETTPEPLISSDLPFPGAVPDESPSGKPKSSASAPVPLVVVQRHFQPDDAARDQLIDALYALLLDVTLTETEQPEPTCFLGARE
jgi:hypothetical protein